MEGEAWGWWWFWRRGDVGLLVGARGVDLLEFGLFVCCWLEDIPYCLSVGALLGLLLGHGVAVWDRSSC